MTFRTYALTLITMTALAVSLAFGFNVAIDPYHYFGTARLDGFNSNKPFAIDQHRIAKIRLLNRAEPRTLILGNSRLDVGLDPASPAWPDESRPVFNMAIPGQGVESTVETLNYALDLRDPKIIFWGIDFLDFLIDPAAPVRPYDPVIAQTSAGRMREVATVAVSIESLIDSVLTLMAQGPHRPEGIRKDGFNATGVYASIVRQEGHAALFRQKNLSYARQLMSKRRALRPAREPTSSSMKALTQALEGLAEQRIKVTLITYPYHADILELIHLAGLSPVLQDWQSWLASTVQSVVESNPSADIQLWDFIGYTAVTTEDVPPPGDKSTDMKWYWESGHFKAAVGEEILDVIFKNKAEVSSGLGTRVFPLTSSSQNWGFARQNYFDRRTTGARRIKNIFDAVSNSD